MREDCINNGSKQKAIGAGDHDVVYYYIRWRLKLEGETENMGVCTKEHSTLSATLLGSYTDHRRHSELNLFRINSE